MHPFEFYLKLGFEHISNLAGYDHILFLVVLCAVYKIHQWKRVLILVTAFTIGHSVTLALVSFDVITIPSNIIKFLIPTTILLTALHNVIGPDQSMETRKMGRNYAMALFFGFIHGMDFSNYFRALLLDNSEVVVPLLAFNVGIELGQILVVLIIVAIAYVFLNLINVKHREWNVFISGAAAGMALISMFENKFW
ncbi:HupE/UreJ family protein [Gilvibacter sp.]|uniref:HupE/UreJ family protein n=1 Tax=Gilvibacter sp. TaxID=2729997 RepID=UPI003F4A6270